MFLAISSILLRFFNVFGNFVSIIHFENAIFIGGSAVEKINERDLFIRKSIKTPEPTAKAPIEPTALPKVPTIKSISSIKPVSSATPSPFSPKTPNACASSIIKPQLYFFLSSTIFSKSAISPSIEKTLSVIIKALL